METIKTEDAPRKDVREHVSCDTKCQRLAKAIALAVAVTLGSIGASGCSENNFEKCLRDYDEAAMVQGKMKGTLKDCKAAYKNYKDENEPGELVMVRRRAEDKCLIAGKTTVDAEARLRANLRIAQAKDQSGRVQSCRKAISTTKSYRAAAEGQHDLIEKL